MSAFVSASSRLSSTALRSKSYRSSRRFFATSSSSSSRRGGTLALILGKPGGGKGTISSKILADFPEFAHMSTGDVLRRHVRDGTEVGMEVKDCMDRGELVPDDLISTLVVEEVARVVVGNDDDDDEGGGSLLLDGFPRTVEQAETLERTVAVDFAVNLNVPDETIVGRISDRWIHPASGRVYSYGYRPPLVEGKDDETGEPLARREDDEPEAVRRRLRSYDEVTAPLVDFYERRGVLEHFHGTESDVIYRDVKRWLEERELRRRRTRREGGGESKL